MALQRVDLVDYPRSLLQEDEICPLCRENSKDDEGKLWVAHLNVKHPDLAKRTEFVHHAHRTCELAVLEVSSLCFMRDVELNLILSPEELKAKRIKILSTIAGGTTEMVVSLAGMLGVTLATDLLLKEIVLQSFPTILIPHVGQVLTFCGTGLGMILHLKLGDNDQIAKIFMALVGLMGAGTTQLFRIQEKISQSNGDEMTPLEYQMQSEFGLNIGLALSMGIPGGMLISRVGKCAGNCLKNAFLALGDMAYGQDKI